MITKERVEKMGLAVVYGDTDSIMINTNTKDAPAAELIGRKVSCVEIFLTEMLFFLQS
jgi:DNA polymerase elongation subunit (family B)